jgi:hypothetical protein
MAQFKRLAIRKSVCRPRVERVQRLDPFFATFTMISAYFSISQIEKPYEIWSFFLGISPTFHQRVTFVALGSTGAPACNFATQSSSEWPSLPAPARGGWNDLEESSNKTTAACRFLVTIQGELDHLGFVPMFETNIDVSDSKILMATKWPLSRCD